MKNVLAGLILFALAASSVEQKTAPPGKAMGSPTAPITMEVFSDYECSHCKHLYEDTLRPLMRDYVAKGKVYYNYEMTDASMEDLHGTSVFVKDDNGAIFHTYSAYARGDERGLGAYMFLDLTPKGRNENGPNYNLTDWVRRELSRLSVHSN